MEAERPLLSGRRICLVTSGPVGSNPRLVKEADALCGAGATVTVVSLDVTGLPHVEQRNRSVLEGAAWQVVWVRRGSALRHLARAASHKAARWLAARGLAPFPVQVHALHRFSHRLAKAASAVPADLYLAHNLGALPAAFLAAKRTGALLGFDAEDFHAGELPEGEAHEVQRRLIRAVEARCLSRCAHLTAASPGIARAYAERYGIPEPPVVLNVFPRDQAPGAWTPRGNAAPGPSLYWFSQTIGPGRGLEDAVRALGRSPLRPHLYLRGTVSGTYRRALLDLASASGAADQVHVLEPAAPQEMARLAAAYDVGLALEPASTPNNQIAWSNKAFTYLLAGIPTLATATPGQKELARSLGGAVQLVPPGDVEALAGAITGLLGDADGLAALRKAAWEAGQARFNWDLEQQRFLQRVATALEGAAGVQPSPASLGAQGSRGTGTVEQ